MEVYRIDKNFDFEKFVRDLDAPDSSLSTFLSTAYINLPDYFTEHFKKKDENGWKLILKLMSGV